MNVFISYQRADTAMAAHALCYALQKAGHEAFVDTGQIGPGAAFKLAIGDAIGRSNLMYALIGRRFDATRLHEPTSVVAYEWQRARFHGIAVVPVLVEGAEMPDGQALPGPLRWFTRTHALALRRDTLAGDFAQCVAAADARGVQPRAAARVLWVDDEPANNEAERQLLRPHGIVFDNVVSSDEALSQLAVETYDLVITDLGRRRSSDRSGHAGKSLLEHPVLRDGGPPVIVYAGVGAQARRASLMALGAFESTNSRRTLIEAVLRALGRTDGDSRDDLRR